MIAHQYEGFDFLFDYYDPVKSFSWGGGKLEKNQRARDITQTQASLTRAKGGGGDTVEGPQRETVPVRSKWESQQGASSSRSMRHLCVFMS